MYSPIIACLLLVVGSAKSWEKCTIEPVPGCTCWDKDRPDVICSNLDLYTLPDLGNQSWYSLDLSYNHLTSITTLNGVRLRYLHMEYNNIRSLMGDFLQDSWESLEWLDLSHNQILWIFKKDLEHFTNLQVLILDHNQLEGFLSAADTPLLNLHTLHLHQNPLEGVINLPSQLDEITLSVQNAAEDMPSSIQVKSSFKLTNTDLSAEWQYLFVKLNKNKGLQRLSLINCSITNLGLWSGTTKFSRKLSFLNLRHNHFTEFPNFSYYFRPSHFNHLDLSYNEIKFLRSDDMKQFNALKTLDLHHNLISAILGSSPLFDSLNSIEWIDISNNLLSKIRKKDIPQKAFVIPGEVQVLLGGNFYRCGCDLKWLWDEAKNQTSGHVGFLTLYEISQNLYCRTGSTNDGIPLIDYDMEAQDCGTKSQN